MCRGCDRIQLQKAGSVLVDWLTRRPFPKGDAVQRSLSGPEEPSMLGQVHRLNSLMRSVLPDTELNSDVLSTGPVSVQISVRHFRSSRGLSQALVSWDSFGPFLPCQNAPSLRWQRRRLLSFSLTSRHANKLGRTECASPQNAAVMQKDRPTPPPRGRGPRAVTVGGWSEVCECAVIPPPLKKWMARPGPACDGTRAPVAGQQPGQGPIMTLCRSCTHSVPRSAALPSPAPRGTVSPGGEVEQHVSDSLQVKPRALGESDYTPQSHSEK